MLIVVAIYDEGYGGVNLLINNNFPKFDERLRKLVLQFSADIEFENYEKAYYDLKEILIHTTQHLTNYYNIICVNNSWITRLTFSLNFGKQVIYISKRDDGEDMGVFNA